MSNPTVKEIVAEYLKNHGYDGLFNQQCGEDHCGCNLNSFMPCDGPNEIECIAAYEFNGLMYETKRQECPMCHGDKAINKNGEPDWCPKCDGVGNIETEKDVSNDTSCNNY